MKMDSVSRKHKDGSSNTYPCPPAVAEHNRKMGGVDNNDQLRGYYHVHLKCRKYYKYIFWFMFDLIYTNSCVGSESVAMMVTGLLSCHKETVRFFQLAHPALTSLLEPLHERLQMWGGTLCSLLSVCHSHIAHFCANQGDLHWKSNCQKRCVCGSFASLPLSVLPLLPPALFQLCLFVSQYKPGKQTHTHWKLLLSPTP